MADSTARFSNWFQIISNIAIIVGLGLVVYELNQSKQLARVQFAQSSNQRSTSIQLAMVGEDPREALAKAVLHPSDLNENDVVALDAYYRSITMGWVGMRIRSRTAGIDFPWQAIVAQSVRRNFSSEPGRRWLRAWAEGIDGPIGMPDVAEIAQRAVQDYSDNHLRSRYELLLAND